MKKITSIIFTGFALAQCAYAISPDNISELGLLYSIGPTVSATNLRDGGYAHTGFLRGTTAPSATTGLPISSVEVSFDGGAYSTATGTVSWTMALPSGSSTWRQDSRHTISIRARDAGGSTSAVTTIAVRKGVNRDINGDGYQDIAISAESHNSNEGRAYIIYGGASGIASQSAAAADAILTGEAGNHSFATNLALADFTGDGYADLIVTARFYNTQQGRAYIFHSAGASGIASTGAASANTVITGGGTGQFGQGLAVGDINGDGYADALISQPMGSTNPGNVYAFHSQGSVGITATAPAGADADISTAVNGLLGNSLALGDINGDGFADAVLGEPQQVGDNIGRAYVFLSQGATGLPTTTTASASAVITGEVNNDTLGKNVLLADINGDGFSDLLLDARAYSSNLGRVYYFQSAGSAGVSTAGAASASAILTGETQAGIAPQFGTSLSAGDVNGDGFLDLQVSAPVADGTVLDAGASYIFLSRGASGLATANASAANTKFAGDTVTGVIASATTFRDMNGDGFADALVTGPLSGGTVYYFQSSGTTGLLSRDLGAGGSTTAIITGESTSDKFGYALER